MQQRRHLKLNNQGSTLLMLMVALTFIAVIATLSMSTSVMNVQMKQIDLTSKDNFYDAEAVLDEIYTGIGHEVMAIASDSYENTLLHMTTETEDGTFVKASNPEDRFRKKYYELLCGAFLDTAEETEAESVKLAELEERLKGYVSEKYQLDAEADAEQRTTVTIEGVSPSDEEQTITIKGLKITYEDGEYISTVKTDVVLVTPKLETGAAGTPAVDVEADFSVLAEYILVAENQIVNEGASTWNGNIYAGDGGIELKNIRQIRANEMITRGDFYSHIPFTSFSDSLTNPVIANIEGAPLNLYAKNLMIQNGLSISGANYYIADDMTIDENGAVLRIRPDTVEGAGTYVGYGMNMVHDTSSAVIINAKNASVVLDGISNMFLGGVAFINLERKKPDTEGNLVMDGDGATYYTGESIAANASQNVYLLDPADITYAKTAEGVTTFRPIGSNPVATSIVNAAELKIESGAEYIRKRAGDWTYLYRKPENLSKQAEYYAAYAGDDRNNLDLQESFKERGLNEIILPAEVQCRGTVTSLESRGGKPVVTRPGVEESTFYATMEEAKRCVLDIQSDLIKDSENIGSAATPYTTYVNAAAIENTNGYSNAGSNDACEIRVVKGDFTIGADVPGQYGIVIATGNITVEKNFNGLILAGGAILVKGDVTLNAFKQVPEATDYIQLISSSELTKYKDGKPSLFDYLRITTSSGIPAAGSTQIKVLEYPDVVYYENWKKNAQ